MQAAGLEQPYQITASHIVRRRADHDLRLLANQLTFVAPGALIATIEGRGTRPHPVFRRCWPLARAAGFAVAPAAAEAAQARAPEMPPAPH